MERIAHPCGNATFLLRSQPIRTCPGHSRARTVHLGVQDRVPSREREQLILGELDVVHPATHGRLRDADGPRDLLDRLSLLATQGAGLVALPYLHRYEQVYARDRTEAGGGDRTRGTEIGSLVLYH